MTETKPTEAQPKPKKPLPVRSPSFPYVDLKRALERAEEVRSKEGRNAARNEVVVQHWGYKPKSSGGKQTIGALRAFGLLAGEGSVRLTETAIRILQDKRNPSPERDALIREAALRPAIHKKLWESYGASLPSDANLAHALVAEDGFNENSVADVIREYKATIDFAKLKEAGNMPPTGEEEGETQTPAGVPMQAGTSPLSPPPVPPPLHSPGTAPPSSPEGTLMMSVPFQGTTLSVRVDVKGELRKEHIRRVVAHLTLAEDDLPGEPAPPKTEKAK